MVKLRSHCGNYAVGTDIAAAKQFTHRPTPTRTAIPEGCLGPQQRAGGEECSADLCDKFIAS
jgi:hypothetical protein